MGFFVCEFPKGVGNGDGNLVGKRDGLLDLGPAETSENPEHTSITINDDMGYPFIKTKPFCTKAARSTDGPGATTHFFRAEILNLRVKAFKMEAQDLGAPQH